ncbi:hypothetical protein [Falsiroseomonas stagni]|uniref:Uncharacterized protein n=1 Tax=Falsiroseomonas stagni DSM 19981 TaxID=1123062 RepID=A0A1I4AFX4_9PROT|nr:hypothetical protein [Falsiroseomonas stagni]SFK54696.1 hypothetical protein SAMN02745775_103390 [Falsiroseomonas stagni DSM 19981]
MVLSQSDPASIPRPGAVPVALALLAAPGSALAQAAPHGGSLAPAPVAAAGVVLVLVLFLAGSWVMLRRLAREMQARAGSVAEAERPRLTGRLMDLPLGVPEGSIRALLSIFIIVLGFLMLALKGPLGLDAGEAVTGFIGAVISFYFAARSGEQARQAAETAADAARVAAGAAERVTGAAAEAPAAPPSPPEPGGDSRLREVQGHLQSLRAVVSAVGTLGVGSGALAGADRALARVDGLLDRIAPVLGGRADAESLGRLAEEAGTVLREVGDLGPVGTAVADAMATVGRAAAESTKLAGMLGGLMGGAGPAGLVAAVVVGGIGLVRDRERFARWKAAMLDTPLDLGLLPPVVDAGLAAAALLRCPPMAPLARQGAVEPALALAVWEAVAGTPPEAPDALAARILAGGVGGDGAAALRAAFEGHAEALADAIEDLRAAMTGAAALAGLDLPRVTVAGASIPTAALASAVREARQDGRVAAEIERLVYMTEALGRADPATLARVSARLADPAFVEGAARDAAARTPPPPAGLEGGSG